MSKTKPASLAGVFAAKGAAKPADATKPVELLHRASSDEAPRTFTMEPLTTMFPPVHGQAQEDVAQASPRNTPAANTPMATKSLTVKIDLATYTKLKAHGGAQGGKTNQDIFVEALGLYFRKYGIK